VYPCHLPKDAAGHLGGQRKLSTDLEIQVSLQPSAATGLAMSEGILAHQIEGVAVCELDLPQRGELWWAGGKLEFGGQGGLHRVPFFGCFSESETEGEAFPPPPEGVGHPRPTDRVNTDELARSGDTYEFEGYLHGNAGMFMILVDMAPAEGPKLHQHPYEEVFIIQEGSATYAIGSTTFEAKAGQIAIVPADVPLKFINSG
jgi:quercetin dioxygenase-like cupin family protein